MTLSQALFSLEGRMSRSDYWLKGVLLLCTLPFCLVILSFFLIGNFPFHELEIGFILFKALLVWVSLAIHVKRLHDLDLPGWYVLILFIPVVGLWYGIQLGFFRGTPGGNKYGEDPVQSESSSLYKRAVVLGLVVCLAWALVLIYNDMKVSPAYHGTIVQGKSSPVQIPDRNSPQPPSTPAPQANDPSDLSGLMAQAQSQYQQLLQERNMLDMGDPKAVQAFNSKAAAYKQLNDQIEQKRRASAEPAKSP